jgi:polar amino acid transport system substrate-binding protein
VRAEELRLALFLPQYDKDPATGAVRGLGMGYVAMELSRALAARLGIRMHIAEHPTPPAAMDSVISGACDIGFFGIEPSRTAQIDFTPPIVQFDYTYLVPAGSAINIVTDADQPGVRIAVVRNHASTMALARKIKHAELIGSDLPDAAFAMLRRGAVAAFAAPREPLLEFAADLPGSRVLADRFGVNNVGLGMKKGQAARLAYFSEFVENAKASGDVAAIIARGALGGFRVAPPGET